MRNARPHQNYGGLGGATERLAGSFVAGSLNLVQFTTSKIETFGGDLPNYKGDHYEYPDQTIPRRSF